MFNNVSWILCLRELRQLRRVCPLQDSNWSYWILWPPTPPSEVVWNLRHPLSFQWPPSPINLIIKDTPLFVLMKSDIVFIHPPDWSMMYIESLSHFDDVPLVPVWWINKINLKQEQDASSIIHPFQEKLNWGGGWWAGKKFLHLLTRNLIFQMKLQIPCYLISKVPLLDWEQKLESRVM